MTTLEGPRRPTLDELRAIAESKPEGSGDYDLMPSVDKAIPARTMDEDTDEALADQAGKAYDVEFDIHVKKKGHFELKGKLARLNFMRGSLGYGEHRLARRLRITTTEKDKRGDQRLANYLGITENQVHRGDLRGRRKKEINRFKEKFNGLFALSSILAESLDDDIDRRIALETPNGKLSEVSVSDAMKAGYINIAVAVALETVRINATTQDQQRTPEPDESQATLNPDDYQPESIEGDLHQIGPLDDEFA